MMRSRFLFLTILAALFCPSVSAQVPASISCEAPINPQLLAGKPEGNIITAKTISQQGLTIPSLWWAQEQFDPFGGRLITDWIAYPNQRRIDLVVNRQLWSLLNYVDRYRFVNKFGTVAREYKYNLRIFDRQNKCLVTYACNFQVSPNRCEIDFEPSGKTGLEVDNQTQDWEKEL
jgi:hypothetical protein